jgi:hypothetical protein
MGVALCAVAVPVARAQQSAPFGDEAPRYDAAADRVSLAAWGPAPEHPANLAQVGLGSRRAAMARARRALHGWLDAAMGERADAPALMTRLHEAADSALREVGVRFLADGTVVLRAELDAVALRSVVAERGLPWVR